MEDDYGSRVSSWQRKQSHRTEMALRLVREDDRVWFAVSRTGKVHIATPLRGPVAVLCEKRLAVLTRIPTGIVRHSDVCGSCAMVAASMLDDYNPPGERGV